MHCAECGHSLAETAMGAFLRCCNGLGYWYDQPPTPDDLKAAIQLGALPKQWRGWWFYKQPTWPKDKKPVGAK